MALLSAVCSIFLNHNSSICFSFWIVLVLTLKNKGICSKNRDSAAQEPTNLKLFKNSLMPKVTKFKTNFSTQKSEKRTLKEITILSNTFQGRQGYTFTSLHL